MTHLYIAIEKKAGGGRRVYAGIGQNHARAFATHGQRVDELLKRAEVTLGTVDGFSTRGDAERAEALLIQALNATGVDIVNTAAVKNSRYVQPLIKRREGTVHFKQLRKTMVVVVSADKIGEGVQERQGAVNFDPIEVGKRCDREWGIGTAIDSHYDVHNLLAVLKKGVAGSIIVGHWATKAVDCWDRDKGIVTLQDPLKWDLKKWRGKELDWDGRHPQKQQFSDDLTGAAGAR